MTFLPRPLDRDARSALRVVCLIAGSAALAGGCASAGSRRPGAVAPDSAAAVAIAQERGIAPAARRTVGVPPFQLPARDTLLTPLGYALADLLATDLSRSAHLQLVERSRLGEVLRELDLTRGGRVDSATAPRLGRLLRAQRLLLGSLDTLRGGELRLSVRVADVESGIIEQALDARAPLTDILQAEKQVAFRLFDALGVTLTPAERALIAAYPTASMDALVAYGRGVEADVLGDPRRAITEFQRALRFDPAFRAATDRGAQVSPGAGRAGAAATIAAGGAGRAIDAPVSGVVDRLNRPLDIVTVQANPVGGPGDPAFPSTLVTVVIVVRRP